MSFAESLLACLVFMLSLAACGERREEAPSPSPRTAAATLPDADARVREAAIVVDANGLSNGGSGSRNALRFGAPRAEVDKLVESALDRPASSSENSDCGAGPMEFSEAGPLQVAYQDGKFVGWYLSGSGGDVITSDGVRPGIALAQVQEWRPVRVIADSTLEGEFEYQTRDGGVITGFFEGSQSDGRIVALQAGLNCFFR